MGPRALRRALEAPADRLVLEVVQLAQHERQPLLERQPVHDALDQHARLAETPLLLGAGGIDIGSHVADPGVRAPPPALGAEVVAREVGRDREQPRPHVGRVVQALPRAVGAQERLLAQVVGVTRPGREAQQVAVDLGVVRRDDRLERCQSHTPL